MRNAEIHRKTGETDIRLLLELDGKGNCRCDTGIGFLDHMISAFSRHGFFDVALKADGDLAVDGHHTAEDTAIVLGNAIRQALGAKEGIARYGHCILPMDEALILSAADFSGRACLRYDLDIPSEKVGDFDTELTEEFFTAFTRSAGLTLHIRQLDGRNSHHIIEGTFKSVARSLKAAVALEKGFESDIPSTKGVL